MRAAASLALVLFVGCGGGAGTASLAQDAAAFAQGSDGALLGGSRAPGEAPAGSADDAGAAGAEVATSPAEAGPAAPDAGGDAPPDSLPVDASPRPRLTISPSTLDFPAPMTPGMLRQPQSVIVRNIGDAVTGVVSAEFSGENPEDFTLNTTCAGPLQPQASCVISIRFSSARLPPDRTATLRVYDGTTSAECPIIAH